MYVIREAEPYDANKANAKFKDLRWNIKLNHG